MQPIRKILGGITIEEIRFIFVRNCDLVSWGETDQERELLKIFINQFEEHEHSESLQPPLPQSYTNISQQGEIYDLF